MVAGQGANLVADVRPFTVASYNVLAAAYMQPGRYRRSPAMVLHSMWRIPAVAGRVASMSAELICLQEVEIETFAAVRARLSSAGYAAEYSRRRGGKPDGLATFYRRETFDRVDARTLDYSDNDGDIALVMIFNHAGRSIGVINTHISWEPREAGERRGLKKIGELLSTCATNAEEASAWIICGDLNATPESQIVAALEHAGFDNAHRSLPNAHTCLVDGWAKTIDYIFFSNDLSAEPREGAHVRADVPLPSAAEPSDHVPVMAGFRWKLD